MLYRCHCVLTKFSLCCSVYVLHLSHTVHLNCRDATRNKIRSVDHPAHQRSNGQFIFYAYISISYGFYIDSFIFWKCQVILKPKAESCIKEKEKTINMMTKERKCPYFQWLWFWKYFCHSFSSFIFRKKNYSVIRYKPNQLASRWITSLQTCVCVYVYIYGRYLFYFCFFF